MNKSLMMQILSQYNYGYNPEYENLSEEEKAYIDYVNECLNERDEKFAGACSKAMLFILELSCKIGTDEEPTAEEVTLKKKCYYLDLIRMIKIELDLLCTLVFRLWRYIVKKEIKKEN